MSSARRVAALAAVASLVAACGLFTNPPSPSPQVAPASQTLPASSSTPAATPTPRIKLVTFIGSIEEPEGYTPTGLAWAGVEQAASTTGATASLVQPASNADLATDIESAAQPDSLVVTFGSAAQDAVAIAAAAHPDAAFLEIGVVPADGSPANVHGLVFDQAQAGYLAGFIAAAFASPAPIGFVGDSDTDVTTENYTAGFTAGADFVAASYPVSFAYGASPNYPDRGRGAASTLIGGGAVVIATMPSLTGIGAMRQACSQQTRLVALERDAWFTVPDVNACLIASVVFRADSVVRDAIMALETGQTLPPVITANVANGGIAVTDFHIDPPAGVQTRLDAVLAALAAEPAASPAG